MYIFWYINNSLAVNAPETNMMLTTKKNVQNNNQKLKAYESVHSLARGHMTRV